MNFTPNLNLHQFGPGDVPGWQSSYNPDMESIDGAAGQLRGDVEGLVSRIGGLEERFAELEAALEGKVNKGSPENWEDCSGLFDDRVVTSASGYYCKSETGLVELTTLLVLPQAIPGLPTIIGSVPACYCPKKRTVAVSCDVHGNTRTVGFACIETNGNIIISSASTSLDSTLKNVQLHFMYFAV